VSTQDLALWINGGWSATREYVEVRSPYDNGLVGRAGIAHADQVREALDATVGTAAPDPLERAAILERVAAHYCENEGPASRLISAESGLCLKDTMHEVKRAVATLRDAANEARRLAETDWEAPYLEAGEVRGPELRVVPEPVRLAVAITPFNHPLNQVVHKVAPAIAAGAPVVLKPSEKTPLSALRLAEVLSKCGLPGNLLNVVTGCPVATLWSPRLPDRESAVRGVWRLGKRRKGRGGPRDPFDDIPAHLLRPLTQRAFS